MRAGRAAERADNWGDAYAALSAAAEVFRDAAAIDPSSARTLGNWGNALLQLGQVWLRPADDDSLCRVPSGQCLWPTSCIGEPAGKFMSSMILIS